MGVSFKLPALLLCVAICTSAQTPVNVLTGNYDNLRTNANLQETILNPSNVGSNGFGKVATLPVDGQIYAQPLYAAGIQIRGVGTRNVLYVATMHNTVYAFDADSTQSTAPYWQVNLGASVPSSLLNFTDILPETGILSTPVIDLGKQVMYVVADSLESDGPVFRLHALSLTDGHEMMNGSAVISAVVKGDGDGSAFGSLAFDASLHLQRPGLALSNGVVYISFGSHADNGEFHGWIFGYSAANVQFRVSVVNLSPNGVGASVWQSGRAPALDASGNLYVATGNGDFDGITNFSESVLKLSSDLKVLDYYTPDNWDHLNENDWDVGSTGVILLPNNGMVTGAKSGKLYLINGPMGHLGPSKTSSVQGVQVNKWGMFDFAVWNNKKGPIVYLQEPWGPLKAFQIVNGRISEAVLSQTDPIVPTFFGSIAISANGSADGTAIVWETTGDYGTRQVPGILHAYDASDVSKELWNSTMSPDRDALGRFAKFAIPTVANGRVYVPTFSNALVIYGLLPSNQPDTGTPQVTAVANGASFVADAVSPGEVLAIFGANLGPPEMMDSKVDDSNHLSIPSSETQVIFGGVSAPLLYTSSTQLGAVVPFGTTGPTTEVLVLNKGQFSPPIQMPVLPATPALFTLDGTGGGQGAILNADGTENAWDNPADRGSVVILYGTGAGQLDPAGDDGRIAGDLPLPVPRLSVTVLIDNQPAKVLYSGVAPGLVQGVLQINVRVPDNASSGSGIPVRFKVGDYLSPNSVTLAIR